MTIINRAEPVKEPEIKALRETAEQGDAAAQYDLGSMYFYGEEIPKDDAEAVKWLRKAAEQGYVEAQFRLGRIYANGRGVPKDDVEAVKCLRQAAEQGHAGARASFPVT